MDRKTHPSSKNPPLPVFLTMLARQVQTKESRSERNWPCWLAFQTLEPESIWPSTESWLISQSLCPCPRPPSTQAQLLQYHTRDRKRTSVTRLPYSIPQSHLIPLTPSHPHHIVIVYLPPVKPRYVLRGTKVKEECPLPSLHSTRMSVTGTPSDVCVSGVSKHLDSADERQARNLNSLSSAPTWMCKGRAL